MWYSNVVCTELLIITVLVSASVSSSLNCSFEVLTIDGNCSTSNNCTNRTMVHFLNPAAEYIKSNCYEIENSTKHICKYANYTQNVELGVKIPGKNEKGYFRIPDKNMNASSNQQDASRARIGIDEIGQYKAAWCADSDDSDKWLEVKFDTPAIIEKIEIKGYPKKPSKWTEKFKLEYTNSTGQSVWFNDNMTFNSTQNGSCHYIFINQATKLRIYSQSPANTTCMQLAIYGKPSVNGSLSKVVPVDPTNKYRNLESASITNEWFLGGYMLWAVFVALLIFLVIFTLTFLCCWCCRRNRPLKAAMEKAKDANPDYVPAWRRIDAKAEKGYIATQEAQEVKIAFTDEYIPPGLQKEKQDATDEKHYRHKIFSFSGRQPANVHMAQDHPKGNQENGSTVK